ncbi:hypothetical protein AC1031_010607 [Aphanomyces cochlioides]|nr:hypothetical protein AC1031_010607 [Aphanomyces cochlioides]
MAHSSYKVVWVDLEPRKGCSSTVSVDLSSSCGKDRKWLDFPAGSGTRESLESLLQRHLSLASFEHIDRSCRARALPTANSRADLPSLEAS